MAFEIELDGMSQEAQFAIMECATYSPDTELGRDPLEILLELEQLAAEEGFHDVHTFIHYLEGEHS